MVSLRLFVVKHEFINIKTQQEKFITLINLKTFQKLLCVYRQLRLFTCGASVELAQNGAIKFKQLWCTADQLVCIICNYYFWEIVYTGLETSPSLFFHTFASFVLKEALSSDHSFQQILPVRLYVHLTYFLHIV